LTWFNVLRIDRRTFWKRVGIASAISHGILVAGFFSFSYFDYVAKRNTTLIGLGFDGYLFNRSEFWRLITIFDTAPMLTLLAVGAILDRLSMNPPLVFVAIIDILIVGTLQWYFVGGGVGLL